MQRSFLQELTSAFVLVLFLSFCLYFFPYLLKGLLLIAVLFLIFGLLGFWYLRRKMKQALRNLEKQAEQAQQQSQRQAPRRGPDGQGPIVHVQAEEIQ